MDLAPDLTRALAATLKQRGVKALYRLPRRTPTPFSDVDFYAHAPAEVIDAALKQPDDVFAGIGRSLGAWVQRPFMEEPSVNALVELPEGPLKLDVMWVKRDQLKPNPRLRQAEIIFDDDDALARARATLLARPAFYDGTPAEVTDTFEKFFGYSWNTLSKIHKGEAEHYIVSAFSRQLTLTVLRLFHCTYQLENPNFFTDLLYARERFGDELSADLRSVPLGFDVDSQARSFVKLIDIFRKVALTASRHFAVPYPEAIEARLRSLVEAHFQKSAQASAAAGGGEREAEAARLLTGITRSLKERGVTMLARLGGHRKSKPTPFSDDDLLACVTPEVLARLLKERHDVFSPHGPVIVCWHNPNLASINAAYDVKPVPVKYDVLIKKVGMVQPDTLNRDCEILLDEGGQFAAMREASGKIVAATEGGARDAQQLIHQFFGQSWAALSKLHKGQLEWFVFQGLSSLVDGVLIPLRRTWQKAERWGFGNDLLYARDLFGSDLSDRVRSMPLAFDTPTLLKAYRVLLDAFRHEAAQACEKLALPAPDAELAALEKMLTAHFR